MATGLVRLSLAGLVSLFHLIILVIVFSPDRCAKMEKLVKMIKLAKRLNW